MGGGRGSQLLSRWLVFILGLGCIGSFVNAQFSLNVSNSSLVVNVGNSSLPIYPPVDVQPTDTCPDASWRTWKLHTTPPKFDPLNWNKSQWRQYIQTYPLRSAGLSIAFLLIGVLLLLVAITWRLVQWCVSCGHCQRCCGVGTQDTAFLKDTKHRYLKAWIYVLIAGALGMAVWGMLALDANLMASFWNAFTDVLQYGSSISDELRRLQDDITVEVPAKLKATAATVNDTVMASRLGSLVQASLNFNNDSKAAATDLLIDAASLRAGVSTGVMPGMATLAVHFGSPIAAAAAAAGTGTGTGRRRLAQSTLNSSAAPYNALSTALPLITGANTARGTMQDRLQALSAALVAFQAEPNPSPSSPELAALKLALTQAPLKRWDDQLVNISVALQVYNASRSGSPFTATKEAADRIIAGARAASPSAVSDMIAKVTTASLRMRTGTSGQAFLGLKALRAHLLNISDQVTPVEDWGVGLSNGTKIGILDVTNFLLASIGNYVTGETSNGTSTVDLGQVDVGRFVQVCQNASATAGGLNAPATNISAAAANASSIAVGGSDPGPTVAQIATSLRPALATLNLTVGPLSAAMAAYDANRSPSNLLALQAAAANASGAVDAAIVPFSDPLAGAAELQSIAQAMTPSVNELQALGRSYSLTSASTYGRLASQNTDMQSYETSLGMLVGVLGQLPNPSDAEAAVTKTATNLQDMVAQAANDLQTKVKAAAADVESAVTKLEDKLLYPSFKIKFKYQRSTTDINRTAYPAAMGAWGLGMLLLLGLALSVFLNWPAGLVTFGLLLLLYVTISQALTSAVAFGMGALDDACTDAELVVMRQLVEHSTSPQLAAAASYYLYKVPADSEIMLQAAFNLNVTDVRASLASINQTITERLDSRYALKGMTATLVNALRDLGGAARDVFNNIIELLRYETINGLYVDTKSVVCCDAGAFAYHEWCAITSAAALAFGALVSAGYLLMRMDMVQQRRKSFCSCCTCACYRPRHGTYVLGGDPESQEDEFIREARKQHKQYTHVHLQQNPMERPPSLTKVSPRGSGEGGTGQGEGGTGQGEGGSNSELHASASVSASVGVGASASVGGSVGVGASASVVGSEVGGRPSVAEGAPAPAPASAERPE